MVAGSSAPGGAPAPRARWLRAMRRYLRPAANSARGEGDVGTEQDPQDQACQANPGQPAAAARVGVLADQAVACGRDIIDGRRQPDLPTARAGEQPPGQD